MSKKETLDEYLARGGKIEYLEYKEVYRPKVTKFKGTKSVRGKNK